MERRRIVLVFLAALALCSLVTKNHVVGWSDRSRFATVDALTVERSFAIDGSPFAIHLGDEIHYRGHTYSDKPPLPAILGAGVALLLAPLGVTLRQTPGTAIYLVTLLTVGVWFGIGCCYAYAFQRRLGFELHVATAVAALTGAGTLVLSYAGVFVNHVPCGAAALAGCYHLYPARDRGARDVALGGLFFALAYAFDAAGVIFAIAAAVLLWRSPLRRWVLCAAAGLPIVASQLGFNLLISGSIVPTAFNPVVWGDPSRPLHAASLPVVAIFSPGQYLAIVTNLLVGARGLFSFTPMMVVAGYGFVRMWRMSEPVRVLALAVLATSTAYFLAIVFLQNDTLARNFGERRYVDLFFMLCIALGPALASIRTAPAVISTRLAIAVSVAIAALGTVAPFGGGPGQSGFVFAPAEFAALEHRAPLASAFDILFLIVLIGLVLRLVPLPADGSQAAAASRKRVA